MVDKNRIDELINEYCHYRDNFYSFHFRSWYCQLDLYRGLYWRVKRYKYHSLDGYDLIEEELFTYLETAILYFVEFLDKIA